MRYSCAVAGVAVLSMVGGLHADLVNTTVHFNAGGDSFSASLNVSGTATLNASGTYYTWAGWPVSSWISAGLTFNNGGRQLGTDPDTVVIQKDPTGNGNLDFERLFTTLDDAHLNQLTADLMGGSTKSFGLDQLVLTEDGFNFLELRLDTAAAITELTLSASDFDEQQIWSYDMPDPCDPFGGPLGKAEYLIGSTGDMSAGFEMDISGGMYIYGVEVWDMGNLAHLSDTIVTSGGIGGLLRLQEVNEPYPKDVEFTLGGSAENPLTGETLTVSMPFSAGGHESNTVWYGSNAYYKINLDWSYDGEVTLGDISYDLYDTIEDIIPEPATVSVLALGGVCMALVRRRR